MRNCKPSNLNVAKIYSETEISINFCYLNVLKKKKKDRFPWNA